MKSIFAGFLGMFTSTILHLVGIEIYQWEWWVLLISVVTIGSILYGKNNNNNNNNN